MTVQVLLDSTVTGTLDEILLRSGLFVGQRGYATDFGKAPHYMPLRWDGTAWDFETEFIPGQTASVHPCPSTTTFSTLGMTVVLTGTATAADVTDSSAIYPRAPRVDILGAGIAAIREM